MCDYGHFHLSPTVCPGYLPRTTLHVLECVSTIKKEYVGEDNRMREEEFLSSF